MNKAKKIMEKGMEGLRKRINQLLSKFLPDYIYQSIVVRYIHFTYRDKDTLYQYPYFHRKKRSRKRYCVFRFDMENWGLAGIVRNYIFLYGWAKENGYIPLVDMEYRYDFERYCPGENNIWEYVFEQPIGIKEVLKKDWVLIKGIGTIDGTWSNTVSLQINGKSEDHIIHLEREHWRNYYIKANQYMSECLTFKKCIMDPGQGMESVVWEGNDTLGVMLREGFTSQVVDNLTDEKAIARLKRHPMTISVEETIELVAKYLQKWNCSRIFLSTEVQSSIDMFKERFGDKVIYLERQRIEYEDLLADNSEGVKSPKEYYDFVKRAGEYGKAAEKAVSYAREIVILSRCKYLFAAPSGGTVLALMLNGGKYEDINIMVNYNETTNY